MAGSNHFHGIVLTSAEIEVLRILADNNIMLPIPAEPLCNDHIRALSKVFRNVHSSMLCYRLQNVNELPYYSRIQLFDIIHNTIGTNTSLVGWMRAKYDYGYPGPYFALRDIWILQILAHNNISIMKFWSGQNG